MSQKSYFVAESYDLAFMASTYSATLGSAKYTAGTMYYVRLDSGVQSPSLNGYMSALWAKGTGSAGAAYLGLYAATGAAAAGTLYQVGVTANLGSVASGFIRKSLGTLAAQVAATGELVGNPEGVYYGAVLVEADAGTDHIDVASSTQYATNEGVTSGVATDPTTNGGFPRAFTGAGTSLSVMPATEAMSGVATSSILPWLAID